jgi:hypothetical protein
VAPADSRMAIRGQAETSRHYSISRPPEMSNAAPSKPVLIIDGSRFANFDGFKREFSILLSDYPWGISTHSTMCYGGGFGTPEGGFILWWTHSDRSRRALGTGHREAVGVST